MGIAAGGKTYELVHQQAAQAPQSGCARCAPASPRAANPVLAGAEGLPRRGPAVTAACILDGSTALAWVLPGEGGDAADALLVAQRRGASPWPSGGRRWPPWPNCRSASTRNTVSHAWGDTLHLAETSGSTRELPGTGLRDPASRRRRATATCARRRRTTARRCSTGKPGRGRRGSASGGGLAARMVFSTVDLHRISSAQAARGGADGRATAAPRADRVSNPLLCSFRQACGRGPSLVRPGCVRRSRGVVARSRARRRRRAHRPVEGSRQRRRRAVRPMASAEAVSTTCRRGPSVSANGLPCRRSRRGVRPLPHACGGSVPKGGVVGVDERPQAAHRRAAVAAPAGAEATPSMLRNFLLGVAASACAVLVVAFGAVILAACWVG